MDCFSFVCRDANGVNEYEQLRAVMIAEEFGWVGFAADIYGQDLQNVTNETLRSDLLELYRTNQTLYTNRIQAAVDLVASFPDVDAENIAIIGYCFGGTGVLTYALTGLDSVKAVVSFHGGLDFIPEAGPTVIPKVLVLSGGEDDLASEIVDLEMTLNNATADWEITRYSGTEHAFTVFADDKYNEWADKRSWASMAGFLDEAIGQNAFVSERPNATTVDDVPYVDVDGAQLQGYLAMPSDEWQTPLTTVGFCRTYFGPFGISFFQITHVKTQRLTLSFLFASLCSDWDGVNQYEKERATLLAELGYVAFAADIYGADLQNNLTMEMKMQYATMYRENMTLFVQRIERAIEEVKLVEGVDKNNIAVIGYCLGGTGTIQLAFSGKTEVKAVVAFHGGLNVLPSPNANVTPYTLM